VPQTLRLDNPAQLDDHLQRFATQTPRPNRPLVLVGAGAQARQVFVGTLAAASDLQLHQVNLSELHDGEMAATQGNIREVFDQAGEAPTVLCLHTADRFYERVARTDAREHRDPDALTEDGYLLDRIDAFGGLVVVSFEGTTVPRALADRAAYVVQI
jgi:hypothetical protein